MISCTEVKRIVYVDDDEEDRTIFTEGMATVEEPAELTVFDSGTALLAYLDKLQSADYPLCIVCDMKMPKLDGMDVLRIIKQSPSWHKIPMIIFSTSSSREDRELAMGLGATAFISKPGTFSEISTAITRILSICSKLSVGKV